ncbi:hypothetical protein HIM_08897 [Hirsutella minnesotensis 3608]|uniref:Phenol hydroxylase-like C-terminal dimerisation domain-containing protein n=1 Tax=Hirsutella minnesotensis 3608 TaxID=1043627 RepID=A0A0F7ZM51_9HYPO|nr:hypothetical protein HIM_08897 [Hirsutella minnesotensis 3608]
MFTGRPAQDEDDGTGVSMKRFHEMFETSQLFTTGVGIRYEPNVLVSTADTTDSELVCRKGWCHSNSDQEVATECRPGTRFASHKVVNQADPRPWELHHLMPSDGRFRIVVFGGNISQPAQRDLVNALGEWLWTSLLPRYPRIALSPAGRRQMEADGDTQPIDVLLVHAADRKDIELLTDLHQVYHPFDAKLGWDHDKTFVDGPSYHEEHTRAYEGYGVDADRGAAVVVRPDGCIGLVTSLEMGRHKMRKWFDAVLRCSDG